MKVNTTPQSFVVPFPVEMAARIRFLAALDHKTPEAYIAKAMIEFTTCDLEGAADWAKQRRAEVDQAVAAVFSGTLPLLHTMSRSARYSSP